MSAKRLISIKRQAKLAVLACAFLTTGAAVAAGTDRKQVCVDPRYLESLPADIEKLNTLSSKLVRLKVNLSMLRLAIESIPSPESPVRAAIPTPQPDTIYEPAREPAPQPTLPKPVEKPEIKPEPADVPPPAPIPSPPPSSSGGIGGWGSFILPVIFIGLIFIGLFLIIRIWRKHQANKKEASVDDVLEFSSTDASGVTSANPPPGQNLPQELQGILAGNRGQSPASGGRDLMTGGITAGALGAIEAEKPGATEEAEATGTAQTAVPAAPAAPAISPTVPSDTPPPATDDVKTAPVPSPAVSDRAPVETIVPTTITPQPSPTATPFTAPEHLVSSAIPDLPDTDQSIELADVMVSIGLTQGATETLLDTIHSDPKRGIYHWLKLLEIYQEADNKGEFTNCANELKRYFNIDVGEWKPLPDRQSQSLENYGHIMTYLMANWEEPDCINYLAHLLEDNRGGARTGFPLEVIKEILFLIAILRAREI